MASGFDTSRYLALFVQEGNEHLEALAKDLVQLEAGPSPALVDSMFRHAHSVKGMASSMGFEGTASLAHRLEDLLDAVRHDATRFDAALGDAVMKAVDALQAHVKVASEKRIAPAEPLLEAQLLEALARLSGQTPAPLAPRPSAPMAQALKAQAQAAQPAATTTPVPAPPPEVSLPPRYRLTLRVSPSSSQPGVRGFLAYKRLSSLGNVFNLKPGLDDVKAGRLPSGLITLEVETDEREEQVRRTLNTVAEIELEALESVTPVSSAPPPKAEAEPEGPRVVGQEPARTVRVRTELLDQFVETAAELVLATARAREVSKGLPEPSRGPMDDAIDQLNLLVRDLHEKVMQARMTPLSVVTDRLPRAARDIARRRSRDVELAIAGADIELDRAIVDELGDPVLHLLRNAIDHGIEGPEERRMRGKPGRGRVAVTVRRQRDQVVIELADDGRGIDADRLRSMAVEKGLLSPEDAQGLTEKEALMLCCLPGLTTADDVTDISGRGVGMDAVKRVVESVGGTLEIESRKGQGTTFRLSLPLTVAMAHLLLVGVGDEVYGLPIARVSGVLETPPQGLARSENASVLHFGQSVVPVHALGELLGVPSAMKEVTKATPFVVVDADDGKLALRVDALLGQQEAVLKAVARPLDLVPGLAGVTILGDGRPVFVLDVARLVPT